MSLMRQADIDTWFADRLVQGPPDGREDRLIDAIFIAPNIGACTECALRRGEYECWSVISAEFAAELSEGYSDSPDGTHCSGSLFCRDCAAQRRRHQNLETDDVFDVLWRSRTRLSDPHTVEDP